MTISLVQHASNSATFTSGTSGTVTVTIGAAGAGNCLVAAIGTAGSNGTPSVSGVTTGASAENWAKGVEQDDGGNVQSVAIWADPGTAGGGASVAVTVAFGATASASNTCTVFADVYEFSGVASVSPVDKTTAGLTGQSGTAWSSGTSGATSQASEVFVGAVFAAAVSGATTITGPGSPWVNETALSGSVIVGGTAYDCYSLSGYQIASSAGTVAYGGTTAGAAYWNAAALSLKGVSGPAITTSSLPGGTVGTAYSQTVTATGGTTPYAWSVSAGSLPPGLTIGSSTGVISGTPTAAGTSSFTVKVTDAASLTATQPLSITVSASAPAFPDAPLGHTIELLLAGAWTDVTHYLDNDQVAIGRGHPDESTTVTASTLAATFQNNDGRFTARNPTGPYYGALGRNVQARVSVPAPVNYLRLEGDSASYASCPHASALNVANLDLRIDLRLTNWEQCQLASMWSASPAIAWTLQLNPTGCLQLFWSTTGSDFPSATSTLPVPVGRLCVRVTLQASTGTVTFYTGPAGGADGSSWTQLGTATVAGATSIFAANTPLTAGNWGTAGTSIGMNGNVYELELRNGIGGTVVAHPVFSAQTAGATSFTDAQSNIWTLNGTAEISSRDYRAHVEVPEWPHQNAPGDKTVTVAIAGGGLLRRTGQLNNPLRSAMYRAYETLSDLVAYWSCEDGANAASFASGLGGPPMLWSGSPALAASSAFACSAPLPQVGSSTWTGAVPAYSGGTANVLRMVITEAAGSIPNNAVIARMQTAGTVAWCDLVYYTGGGLGITGYSQAGAQLFSSGPFSFGVDGGLWLAEIDLWQNGSAVDWSVNTMAPGAAAQSGTSGSIAASSIGRTLAVGVNPGGAAMGATVIGHLAVQSAYNGSQLEAFGSPLDAWQGETAGARFARLCGEQGIAFRGRGNMQSTAVMGPQTMQTLPQLLQECADADRGVWYELRQQLGWGYIARSALYNQPAQVTLDYDQDNLSVWASPPTEDDQIILNDVTITQTNGGTSARQYAAPGQPITGGINPSLSVLPPPNGVGTYDSPSTPQVNLLNAADLVNTCGWMLHMGTVGQPRFPGISIDLANRALASQFWSVADMDLGDRLVIVNPPAWMGPDAQSQLCQQYAEVLSSNQWMVTVCGVPETPYEVAQDGMGFHVDTDGTTLAAGVSSTATSMSFATAAGHPLWTTSAGDFPFDVDIAGERVTVTNITGSSSPQTATVTRSVNGVVKAQAVNTPLSLFTPPTAPL